MNKTHFWIGFDCLLLISLSLVLFFALQPIYASERCYPEGLKAEYQDLNFRCINHSFKAPKTDYTFPFISFDNSLLGYYTDFPRVIILDTNESDLARNKITLKQLICHEVKHYDWYNTLSKEEREYWEGEWNNNPSFAQNKNEYHSEYYEINWEECYEQGVSYSPHSAFGNIPIIE